MGWSDGGFYFAARVTDDVWPGHSLSIVRTGTATSYEMLIPWSELRTAAPRVGRIFRVNCVIGDNDGSGRKCWLEVPGDISDRKGSSTYREFMFIED